MTFGIDKVAYSLKSKQNTDFFLVLDISVPTTPFGSPKVSLRTSSEGGKHWAVFFPTQTQTCLPALNGTLCASLLVFEWVWGHTETRLGPVLQWEGFARYLAKKVNSSRSRVEQETLPRARVLWRCGYMHAGSQENSLPGSWLCFPFYWPALLPLLGNLTPSLSLQYSGAKYSKYLEDLNIVGGVTFRYSSDQCP